MRVEERVSHLMLMRFVFNLLDEGASGGMTRFVVGFWKSYCGKAL